MRQEELVSSKSSVGILQNLKDSDRRIRVFGIHFNEEVSKREAESPFTLL